MSSAQRINFIRLTRLAGLCFIFPLVPIRNLISIAGQSSKFHCLILARDSLSSSEGPSAGRPSSICYTGGSVAHRHSRTDRGIKDVSGRGAESHDLHRPCRENSSPLNPLLHGNLSCGTQPVHAQRQFWQTAQKGLNPGKIRTCTAGESTETSI